MGNFMPISKLLHISKTTALAAVFAISASHAMADTIEGKWRTQSGETAAITKCGGAFCIKLKTGEYAGKSIGQMKGAKGKYKGSITDPADDKKYSGTIKINGSTMKMKGCVAYVLCKTQTWNRM
jgi:uncharacterized protein (DUF2147 family)